MVIELTYKQFCQVKDVLISASVGLRASSEHFDAEKLPQMSKLIGGYHKECESILDDLREFECKTYKSIIS